MRPKRQGERRAQLARAARGVLLSQGAVGLRVKDVAERAAMAPSSVLYYYPDIADLLLDVTRGAMDRYAEGRAGAVRAIPDPADQLREAIRLGVPTGPDDEESRLLYELDALTGTSTAFDVLSSAFYDRQVDMYAGILAGGASAGRFTLAADPVILARGLVAMEDGLGLQVVIGHPAMAPAEAQGVLTEFAAALAGVELTREPAAGGRSRAGDAGKGDGAL